ncbi:MAG: MlaE family lipid ABC transporter permease subunit [Thermodesulfobacteriota bacterium]
MEENREGASYELSGDPGKGLTLFFSGVLDRSAYETLLPRLRKEARLKPEKGFSLDVTRVSRLDDYGALLLFAAHDMGTAVGQPCTVASQGPVRELLALFGISESWTIKPLPEREVPGAVERLGGAFLDVLGDLKQMMEFTGALVLCLAKAAGAPRLLRFEDTLYSMRRVGVDAVPIVALISFLLGFIIAFMSSVQLKQFGANVFVASLVGLAMVRELGPIMTAIIVAGRSGSAFASEIGTMKVNEEVSALSTMGFDPVLFLVVPKLLGSLAVVPFLALFACAFGIFGGLCVGVFVLDLTFDTYLTQTIKILKLSDLMWALGKSGVFAVLVAWVGCLRGFQVRGGAIGVGEAATSAVVSGIFLVIFWDSIFAFIQLYWG